MKNNRKQLKREKKNIRRMNELNRQNSKVSKSNKNDYHTKYFESIKTESDSNYVEIKGKVNFPKISDFSNPLSSQRNRLMNYETRLMGGMKSLREDSFVRNGNPNVIQLENYLRMNPQSSTQSTGNDSGTIFLFHWSLKHNCFICWRVLKKEWIGSKGCMNFFGSDMTSIVNRDFVRIPEKEVN